MGTLHLLTAPKRVLPNILIKSSIQTANHIVRLKPLV